MTALELRKRVDDICSFLTQNELAINFNAHIVYKLDAGKRRITWSGSNVARERVFFEEVLFSEYMKALRFRDFSVLMYDGGIIQLSLDYKGKSLIGYRQVYIPCPVNFELDDLRDMAHGIIPLEDFIEDLDLDELRDRMRIRPVVRFEYDPDTATDNHPSSHLHLGRSECRIPVSGPMSLQNFLRFIFKNFYSEQFSKFHQLRNFKTVPRITTITQSQCRETHVRIGV